jgi:4-hydroxy-tetrahydrodipicolinate reductase
VGPIGVPIAEKLGVEAGVLLDFSSPDGAADRACECAERGLPVVVGTTGLTDDQLGRIEEASARVAVLVAPNMSVGVNVMFELVAQTARALGDGYDIEVVEMHHRRKKDAPSGTALELARRLCDALGRDESQLIFGREGAAGPRTPQEIAVHAVRGGDVVGEHTVIFAGDGERIELTHRASSRDVFVHGALRAARFLAGQPAGLYSMRDLLGSGQA